MAGHNPYAKTGHGFDFPDYLKQAGRGRAAPPPSNASTSSSTSSAGRGSSGGRGMLGAAPRPHQPSPLVGGAGRGVSPLVSGFADHESQQGSTGRGRGGMLGAAMTMSHQKHPSSSSSTGPSKQHAGRGVFGGSSTSIMAMVPTSANDASGYGYHHRELESKVQRKHSTTENPYMALSPSGIEDAIAELSSFRSNDISKFDIGFKNIIRAIMTFDCEETKRKLTSTLIWEFVFSNHRLGNAALERLLSNNLVDVSVRIETAKFMLQVTNEKSFESGPGMSFRVYVREWLSENEAAVNFGFQPVGQVAPRPNDSWVRDARKLYAPQARIDVDSYEEEPFSPVPQQSGASKRKQLMMMDEQQPYGDCYSAEPADPKRQQNNTWQEHRDSRYFPEANNKPTTAAAKSKYSDSEIDAMMERQQRMEAEMAQLRQQQAWPQPEKPAKAWPQPERLGQAWQEAQTGPREDYHHHPRAGALSGAQAQAGPEEAQAQAGPHEARGEALKKDYPHQPRAGALSGAHAQAGPREALDRPVFTFGAGQAPIEAPGTPPDQDSGDAAQEAEARSRVLNSPGTPRATRGRPPRAGKGPTVPSDDPARTRASSSRKKL